jgi:hypothetical protein
MQVEENQVWWILPDVLREIDQEIQGFHLVALRLENTTGLMYYGGTVIDNEDTCSTHRSESSD